MNEKICKSCGFPKPLTSFDRVGVNKLGEFYYRSKCHQCRWPVKKARRAKIRDRMETFKKKCLCIKCNNPDFRVLDFHHREDNKELEVSNMIGQGFSEKVIFEEIAKCDILCANCHRILHYEEKLKQRVA